MNTRQGGRKKQPSTPGRTGKQTGRNKRPGTPSTPSTPRSGNRKQNFTVTSPDGRGLPIPIQKNLLEDIELGGGLSTLNLSRLCTLREDLYGKPNSKTRRQVQNKVDKWKKLSSGDYRDLLQQFGILTRQKTPPSTSSASTDRSSSSVVSEDLSEDAPARPAPRSATPARSASKRSAVPARRLLQPTTTMLPPEIETRLSEGDYDEITADDEHPERNREVSIFKHLDMETEKGRLLNCLEFRLQGDMRLLFMDLKNPKYRAWLHNGNQVVILFPSETYDLKYEKKRFDAGLDSPFAGFTADEEDEQGLVRASYNKERVKISYDTHRNADESPRLLVVSCPDDVELLNSFSSGGGDEEESEIKGDLHLVETEVVFNNKTYNGLTPYFSWKLGIEEENHRKRQAKKTSHHFEELLGGFSGMNMG